MEVEEEIGVTQSKAICVDPAVIFDPYLFTILEYPKFSPLPLTVSVLWQEEGYTVKYSLSTREIARAEPEGSSYISPYIPTWVIIQTFSISKSYTSSIVLPDRAILEEFILGIGLAAGAIFSLIAQ